MDCARRLTLVTALILCSTAFFSVSAWSKTGSVNTFEENGKVGLKNDNGDVLIPAQYDALGWSDGSFSVVENVTGYSLNGRWGIINLTNHKITRAEYEDLSPASPNLIIARKKLPNSVMVRAGCLTPVGKVIIPFEYDGLRVANLRAIVYRRNGARFLHGVIDFDNNIIIPLEYQNIYPLGTLRFGVTSFDGKTAVFTDSGERLTGFVIDSLSSFRDNMAIMYQEKGRGVISREGKILLEPVYRDVELRDEKSVRVKDFDRWELIGSDNRIIKTIQADDVDAFDPNGLRITSAGKAFVTDANLKPLHSGYFRFVGKFHNGFAIVRNGQAAGLISRTGRIVIPVKYQQLFPEGGFVRATQRTDRGLKWILLDTAGRVVSAKQYDLIESFNGSFFPVKHRGYRGALSTGGKEIVACVHDSLVQVHDDKIVVRFRGQYGVINTQEDWIITPQTNRITLLAKDHYLEFGNPTVYLKSFSGGLIYFSDNKLELAGKYLIETLSSGEKWKISMEGVIVERFPAAAETPFIGRESEGYTAIRRDGKYGFVDNRDRLRIANRYEDVRDFSEGLAGAKILGKWGYVSKEDRIVIQPVYDEVFPFRDGLALVRQKEFFGVIDKSGKVVVPVRYETITRLENRKFRLEQGGLVGLADGSGQIILNPKYDEVLEAGKDAFIVSREGKYGAVSASGMSTIPMVYDQLRYDAVSKRYLGVTRATWTPAAIK